MGVIVIFGDSRSNRSGDIRVAQFVMDKRRTTPADGPSPSHGILPKNAIRRFAEQQAHQLAMEATTEVGPKAVGNGIYRRLFELDNCRREAASDVISGKFVGPIIPDEFLQFGGPC